MEGRTACTLLNAPVLLSLKGCDGFSADFLGSPLFSVCSCAAFLLCLTSGRWC